MQELSISPCIDIVLKESFKEAVLRALSKESPMERKKLLKTLQSTFPLLSEGAIGWRLYDLVQEGVIHKPGYGLYALHERKDYQPAISVLARKLYLKVNGELPYAKLCVWESRWLNEFMRHQMFKGYLVVEIEKDAVSSAFHILTDVIKQRRVFLNPKEDDFEKYISLENEAVIVKTLISEAPLEKREQVVVASLEKLLVDCLTSEELFAAQQAELDLIFKIAFQKYSLNVAKMRRYARRRNLAAKLETFIAEFWQTRNTFAKT
jgi:hypothetical protein